MASPTKSLRPVSLCHETTPAPPMAVQPLNYARKHLTQLLVFCRANALRRPTGRGRPFGRSSRHHNHGTFLSTTKYGQRRNYFTTVPKVCWRNSRTLKTAAMRKIARTICFSRSEVLPGAVIKLFVHQSNTFQRRYEATTKILFLCFSLSISMESPRLGRKAQDPV
jgi:hypothetical protein